MKALIATLAVMAAVLGLLLACGKSVPISAREPADGGTPIDTDVMAYLSEARALHHQANLKEDERDLPGAIDALERLVRAPTPHAAAHVPAHVPEVEEVLADTYARLAELHLASHDLAGAEVAIRAGLQHAPEPTYFRGHLLEVSGIIEEARAGAAADAGQATAASAIRAQAIDLLNQAVRIQDQVITRSLGAADGGEGGRP
jgi:hypothetical protein